MMIETWSLYHSSHDLNSVNWEAFAIAAARKLLPNADAM
jgi:hypothetical protein